MTKNWATEKVDNTLKLPCTMNSLVQGKVSKVMPRGISGNLGDKLR